MILIEIFKIDNQLNLKKNMRPFEKTLFKQTCTFKEKSRSCDSSSIYSWDFKEISHHETVILGKEIHKRSYKNRTPDSLIKLKKQ